MQVISLLVTSLTRPVHSAIIIVNTSVYVLTTRKNTLKIAVAALESVNQARLSKRVCSGSSGTNLW